MRLKTAVGIFIGISVALFIALAVSLLRTADLLDRSAMEVALAGESIRLVEELKSKLLTHNRNSFLYSLQGEPWRRDSRRAQRLEINRTLANLQRITADAEEDRVLAVLVEELETYFQRRRALAEQGLTALEQYSQVSQYVDEALEVSNQLVALNSQQMTALLNVIHARNDFAKRAAVGLLLLGALTLLGLIAGIYLSAARPLARLARAVEEYGGGRSHARVEPKGLMEIKRIGLSFNAMADGLEQRQQDQLRFVASIAHDLRNPLQSIRLAADLLAFKSARRDGWEREREIAEMLSRQVRNLDLMLQDLLDTSRIEAGQLKLKLTCCDLTPLLRDAVDLHQGGTELHTIALELPDQAVLCACDALRFSQVMNNLLSNAIKYSPSGGRIVVRAAVGTSSVEVSVCDQGIGIEAHELGNIFKPFQRTQATRETIPGIGLGLSASRRIVEAHGGVLVVESNPGEGSTFKVVLPRTKPEASTESAPRNIR